LQNLLTHLENEIQKFEQLITQKNVTQKATEKAVEKNEDTQVYAQDLIVESNTVEKPA
jgi:diacylglycerol O-acyltransferase